MLNDEILVKNINWLNNLSQQFRNKLIDIALIKTLSPKDHITLQQLTSSGVTYFAKGTAVATMQTPNLKTINSMVLGLGDWFGDYQSSEQANVSFKFSIWAPTSIIHFENSRLRHLIADDLEVYSWLYHISLASRPKWLQAQLVSHENKRTRIVYMLLELAIQQCVNSSNIVLPISQQALSDMVGISRQRVNEVLVELQTVGLLNLERSSIRITNFMALGKILNQVDLSFRDPRKHI